MTPKQELIKSSTSSLLLSLLAEQPMYGYQIVKELESRSQGYFKFKEGTLYPALHRLEKAGLIVGTWQEVSSGRQRRYYRITAQGEARLLQDQNHWESFYAAIMMIMRPGTSRV